MIVCDTDVLIDVLRKFSPAIEWARRLESEEVVIPGYVALQLVQGCRSKYNIQSVLTLLRPYRLAWPSVEFCNHAYQSLVDFRLSTGLDLIDALIAQTAIALQTPLYTFNVKHFSAFTNPTTVQPYAR